jgi:hypothetical protein
VTRTLADVFADDPCEAVLNILRAAGTPLGAGEINAALVTAGVAKADADKHWAAVQKSLKESPQVVVGSRLYRWSEQPTIAATEALDLLGQSQLPAARRAELIDVVRAALGSSAALGSAAATGGVLSDQGGPVSDEFGPPLEDREAQARLRQAGIDGLRALSELAAEVEELVANEVDPAVLVRRVRARVRRSGLEAIDRAGEQTTFDRRIHAPIDGPIRDGARVNVVRPGYVWSQSGTDLLIGKAVVEE